MDLTRRPDWPERLAEHIARHRTTPFAWGVHDCARFAADAVEAITGRRIVFFEWAGRVGAAQVLRRTGGLIPAVDAVLPRLPGPAWAQRGDVLLMQAGARRWLAVADGAQAWAPHRTGLLAVPIGQAVLAWRVGHG